MMLTNVKQFLEFAKAENVSIHQVASDVNVHLVRCQGMGAQGLAKMKMSALNQEFVPMVGALTQNKATIAFVIGDLFQIRTEKCVLTPDKATVSLPFSEVFVGAN